MDHPTLFDHALVGLLIAVGLFAVLVGQRRMKAIEFDEATRLSLYWSNGIFLWIGGALTVAVWMLAGRPLTTLGLTVQQDSIALGALVTLAFIIWFGADSWRDAYTPARRRKLFDQWQRNAPMLPTTPREYRHFTFIAVAAGVNEEIIARGFLISYLLALFGRSTSGLILAVTLPAIAFGLVHLYQGWLAVLRIIVLAGAFGAIFLITESLLIPIALHIIIDLASGWFAVRLSEKFASPTSGRSKIDQATESANPPAVEGVDPAE